MNFIKKEGSAKASKGFNLRKGQPSTSVAVVRQVSVGEIIKFVGSVDDGESVGGNAVWFKTEDDNYFWSGNVQVVPDQLPTSDGYKPVTAAQLCNIISCVPGRAAEIIGPLNQAMLEFAINTPLRQAAFIAQTAHESIGFTAFRENLNYSAQALVNTWPRRFTVETAKLYARQPEKIANCAYASRIGNGNEASGDGWRYRGRGMSQVTGRDNYKACGVGLSLDLLSTPELLEQLIHAFRSGAWFWKSRNLNLLADKADFLEITKAINGGTNGQDDRERYYAKAKTALGIA